MSTKQATSRYFWVFVPAMLIFLASSLGLKWLETNSSVSAPVFIGLAIVPIVALLSMFWLHWRHIQEIDEYLRLVQIKALLFGAAIAMSVATGWGYLENYADVPAMPMFWLNPIFWIAYAVAGAFNAKSEGGSAL